MRIAMDLDGVCFDFVEAFRQFCLKHKIGDPEMVARPALQWDFFTNDWGISREEFEDAIWVAIGNWDLYARPDFVFPGVVAGMHHLKELGHTLSIITDRSRFGPSGLAAAQTFQWLEDEGIPYDTVTFAQHKGEVLQADIAFDDATHHWQSYRDAGVICVLRTHPFNAAAPSPALRADHFDGFVHLVENLERSVDIAQLRALYTAPTQRSNA